MKYNVTLVFIIETLEVIFIIEVSKCVSSAHALAKSATYLTEMLGSLPEILSYEAEEIHDFQNN